jgi:hypothetical protein
MPRKTKTMKPQPMPKKKGMNNKKMAGSKNR